MVKTKNKKRVSADVLTIKKTSTKAKKDNPFEVHTNKEKFTIMGRQLKHDKGMPGVSRGKALKRRTDTLGQEYLQKGKVNSFRDRRIGETTMTREEAASARFIAERLNQQKAKRKDSLFNLNDDDLLTHKGQTLGEIEQFGDTRSDDDDDDDEIGKLNDEFTGVAHFGGADMDRQTDRQSAIDDLIADQKRRKKEISKEKEAVSELTHQLDSNWKALIPLMAKMSKEDEKKPKPDDYDRALREMIFEPRGDVSDKLKTEAEIVKVEKDKLEKMERDRQERMQGITEEEKRQKHRSADDLDDGYFLQPVLAEKATLAYDLNGKSKAESSDSDDDEDLFGKAKAKLAECDEDDDEESGDGGEEEESEEGDEDADEEEESEDDVDNLSDLKDTESEEEEEEPKPKRRATVEPSTNGTKTKTMSEAERQKMMAKAAAELPYTFDLPESFDDFEHLFKDRNAEFQSVILERMIKCNHPKIVHENKSRMVTLFGYLLQHINDTFESATPSNVEDCFRVLDRLCPFLYDLSTINPAETTKCFQGVIKEKQQDFRGGHVKHFPTLDTLVFLKLASNLYSTSDYRHSIVTPCYIFISELLSRCRVVSRADIASGLFLVTVALEYAQLSKRFLPAAVNFLAGVIFLCIPKRPIEMLKVIPPFKSTGEQNCVLVLDADSSEAKNVDESHLKARDLVTVEIDESAKVRLLNNALKLATDTLNMVADNVGAQYFESQIDQHFNKLDLEEYPQFVRDSAKACVDVMESIRAKPLSFLVPAEKKPKALRMLEPKFEKVYDDKRTRRPGNKDKVVRDGMIRKIKSETRGAIREIRRDNAFITKMQLKKQMQSDAERKEKVRRIFSEASIQQGELNAMDRKKKHM